MCGFGVYAQMANPDDSGLTFWIIFKWAWLAFLVFPEIIDDTMSWWHEYDTSRQNFINQQEGIWYLPVTILLKGNFMFMIHKYNWER